MRVLSVDLGTRNLAWCVLTKSKDDSLCHAPFNKCKADIHAWRLVDISNGSTDNMNDIDIATCVPWFVKTIRDHFLEMTDNVDVAFIEAQPTARVIGPGKSVNNVKTKVLSHILQALLLDAHIPVKFVSPSKKLKDAVMANPEKYRDHKTAAVKLTDIASSSLGEWGVWWTSQKGKKDDLADAFLQAMYASYKEPSAKKRVAKKPKLSVVISAPEFVLEDDDESL